MNRLLDHTTQARRPIIPAQKLRSNANRLQDDGSYLKFRRNPLSGNDKADEPSVTKETVATVSSLIEEEEEDEKPLTPKISLRQQTSVSYPCHRQCGLRQIFCIRSSPENVLSVGYSDGCTRLFGGRNTQDSEIQGKELMKLETHPTDFDLPDQEEEEARRRGMQISRPHMANPLDPVTSLAWIGSDRFLCVAGSSISIIEWNTSDPVEKLKQTKISHNHGEMYACDVVGLDPTKFCMPEATQNALVNGMQTNQNAKGVTAGNKGGVKERAANNPPFGGERRSLFSTFNSTSSYSNVFMSTQSTGDAMANTIVDFFKPQASKFCVAGTNRYVVVYDVDTLKEVHCVKKSLYKDDFAHSNRISAVKFLPDSDGQVYITASWDNTVGIWDVRSGKRERAVQEPLCMVGSGPESIDITANGSTLMTASYRSKKPVQLFDFGTCNLIENVPTSSNMVPYTSRFFNNTLAVGGRRLNATSQGSFCLYDIDHQKMVYECHEHASAVWSCEQWDNSFILGHADGDVTVWKQD